ncbi:helix-turn-helix transcriptional regulator [Agrobacterium rhizogenes]|uniref:helix-turn-helix domain-containing protein n=1 Tax=Rhizobium rhizogenes TaxID=359 RepID=UPI0009BD3FB6|nr:helix-turn-helix domain-containing protein [Rhizobium rhizogenes]NTI80406.1 helix-turn-helix transcriptional regulator [Rhizobium rhizogenes]NTJ22592.1 helix-turn-helix transcriptional regulator [Rhizobium rhizogenes]NTJ46867.1 helix-turn-helix transcriptional regulator [Rhizobium rhizogenes]QUE81298.1 helix-turn-helix transcriptional regulator [Rhizobium rhizogenes]TQO80603.1 helix-turn-helix transcriptional regulator [Rhizobium rhizogenes]
MATIAENLKRHRKLRGISQVQLADKSGVSQQLISQLETSKNQATTELPAIAAALGVAVHEIDEAYTPDEGGIPTATVPHLSWISAGAMLRDDIADEARGTIRVADLPPTGDWIALTVVGDSMDRISPPESVILVNRRDKHLVSNACYVIADEEGNATYKRYRPGPTRFEPVSTNPVHEPIFPENDPIIVGRVRRSILEM